MNDTTNKNSEPAITLSMPMSATPARTIFPDDHPTRVTHSWSVVGELFAVQATVKATPIARTPGQHHLPDDHHSPVNHPMLVVGEPSAGPAIAASTPIATAQGQHPSPSPAANRPTITNRPAPQGWDVLELRIAAEEFASRQQERLRSRNRMRLDWADGGYGDVFNARMAPVVEAMEKAEAAARLAMVRTYRLTVTPAVREWQQTSLGIGEHTIARLLGIIGDPCVKIVHKWEGTGSDRSLLVADPEWRTVSELWSYCGHGDAARRKRKGMSADEAFMLGSPGAKSTVWNIAVACIKVNRGPYREAYDEARTKYAERDWTDGHRHAAALRFTGKRILRDLWRVRHAELTGGQP